jgi:flagellar protein FliS
MQDARQAYLETQLLTATPQRLRLTLIEGALRFAHLTLQQWEAGSNDEAFESLLRCRGIVTELMAAIRPDGSDVAKRVLAVYVFIFQALTEAQVRRDAQKLDNAIQILEIERDTWRELCEKMPEAPEPEAGTSRQPKEITSSGVIPTISSSISAPSAGSFSLDA